MSKRKMSAILYDKYSYLAQQYASKVYNYSELCYEYNDLVQEFSIKIFMSLKAYGRRYLKYQRGEASKPIPIEYYLKSACSNKVRDFIKYISRENYKVHIEESSHDFGADIDTFIEPERNRFILHGVDLLEGLTGKERAIFSMYLRGYQATFLNKVYFSTKAEKEAKKAVLDSDDEVIDAKAIIEFQCKRLINKYGATLRQATQVFHTYKTED